MKLPNAGHLELAKQPIFPDGTTDPVELRTIEDLCVCHLAAKPAEMRYLRQTLTTSSEEQFSGIRWPSGDSDVTGAIRLAFAPHAENNLGMIRTYLYRIWDKAKAFVYTPEWWHIIQALAVELLQRQHIPKAEVLLIIKTARETFRLRYAGSQAPVHSTAVPIFNPTREADKEEMDQLPATQLTDPEVLKRFRESLLLDLCA